MNLIINSDRLTHDILKRLNIQFKVISHKDDTFFELYSEKDKNRLLNYKRACLRNKNKGEIY